MGDGVDIKITPLSSRSKPCIWGVKTRRCYRIMNYTVTGQQQMRSCMMVGHGMLWAGGGLEGGAGSRYMEVYLKSAVL